MLALIAIGCCVVVPFIVAGLALLVGKSNDSKNERPSAPPLGSTDREGSRRSGGQPLRIRRLVGGPCVFDVASSLADLHEARGLQLPFDLWVA